MIHECCSTNNVKNNVSWLCEGEARNTHGGNYTDCCRSSVDRCRHFGEICCLCLKCKREILQFGYIYIYICICIYIYIYMSSSSSCSGRIRFDSCSLYPQNENGPSISSSVVLCVFVLLVYIVVLV